MNQITSSSYFGVGAALSAAIFWSIAVIIFKSASEEISPFLITALKNTIATICFFSLFIFIDIPIWYDGFETLDYLKIVVSGILGMGLADVIFLYALSKIGANRIALINCFEPVVIYILSVIFLSTVLTSQQILGFVIVIIAILIINYEKDIDDLDFRVKRLGIMLQISAVILSSIGILTPAFMRHYRRHAIVFILFLSAFITPPDPISLIFMSIPLAILYEISIAVSWMVNRKK